MQVETTVYFVVWWTVCHYSFDHFSKATLLELDGKNVGLIKTSQAKALAGISDRGLFRLNIGCLTHFLGVAEQWILVDQNCTI